MSKPPNWDGGDDDVDAGDGDGNDDADTGYGDGDGDADAGDGDDSSLMNVSPVMFLWHSLYNYIHL